MTVSEKRRASYLQLHDFERVEDWCKKVRVLTGHTPYLVGSVHDTPDFRDVDVRVILPDAVFDRWWSDPMRVRYVNAALSDWGTRETGLPIDLQVQRQTEANKAFGGEYRNPMGTRDWATMPPSGTPGAVHRDPTKVCPDHGYVNCPTCALRSTPAAPQPDAGLREAAQAVVKAWDHGHGEPGTHLLLPTEAEMDALRAALGTASDTIDRQGWEIDELREAAEDALHALENVLSPRQRSHVAEATKALHAALRSTPAAPKEDDRA